MDPCRAFVVIMLAAFAGVGLLPSSSAVAQSPDPVADTAQPLEGQSADVEPPVEMGAWYGYQTLAVDLAAVLLLSADLENWSNAAVAPVILGYLVIPPAIHGFHGNETNSGRSFAVRLAVVIATGLTAVVGLADDDCEEDRVDCPTPAFVWFFWVAGGATGVIDALYAREPVLQQPQNPHDATASFAVRVLGDGAMLSMAGRF